MTLKRQTLVDQMLLHKGLIGQGVQVGVLIISEEEDNVWSRVPRFGACHRSLGVAGEIIMSRLGSDDDKYQHRSNCDGE